MTKAANDYQYWSKTADRFDAASTYILGTKTQKAARVWLNNQITATDMVLEIGCGTGFFSSVIAEKAQHLTTTDMSQEMLVKAQARLGRYANVEIQVADGDQVTYATQTYDVVFMGNLVHIVREPITVLREGHQLLKAGGRLVLIDYTLQGMSGLAKLGMMLRYLSQYGLPPRTNKNYGLEQFKDLVQSLPFTVREAQCISRETNVLCLCAIKN